MDTYMLRINTKFMTAKIVGYDQPDADVVQWTDVNIVLKVPGHKVWVQRPPDSYRYYPAEYCIYLINNRHEEGDITELRTYKLTEFPVKAKRIGE